MYKNETRYRITVFTGAVKIYCILYTISSYQGAGTGLDCTATCLKERRVPEKYFTPERRTERSAVEIRRGGRNSDC